MRQAIAYAISREAIVGSLYKGTGRVASGMLAPENWAYNGDVQRYPYDPFKASRLLDEAGYPIGPTGTRDLKFVYKTTPEGRRLGEAIQAMLRQIGITLDIRTNEFATFYSDIQKGNFDLTSLDWVANDLTHQYFMVFDSKMTPPSGLQSRWLLESRDGSACWTGDRHPIPRPREIYAQVQKLAATDLPYVSLWWEDNVVVMNRRRGGLRTVSQRQPALACHRVAHARGRDRARVIGYFVRRLVALVPVALGVATMTFALIHLVPGDPVVAMLGDTAAPADIDGLRHELGLDRPLRQQYAGFLRDLAHGTSANRSRMQEPVAHLIAQRFPATLELARAGLLVAMCIALPLGLVAGADPGGPADLGAMGFAILGISIPHLYLGPLLMIVSRSTSDGSR